MATKFFDGPLTIQDLADVLVTRFNRANLVARKSMGIGKAVVQIGSSNYSRSGGDTALGVTLLQNENGVSVTIGEHPLVWNRSEPGIYGLGCSKKSAEHLRSSR